MQWFDALVSDAGIEFGRFDVEASFTLDLSEVAWSVAGPTEYFLESLADVFDQVGAAQEGRVWFERIGMTLMPATVGMSFQVGAAGTDATWHIPEELTRSELDELDLPSGLTAMLRKDVGDVVELEGGLGPVAYVGATSRLAITVDDRAAALAAVFTTGHHRPPPMAMIVALSELHDGDFLRSDWFDDRGPVRRSVIAVEPSASTLLAVSSASNGAPDETLAELIGTLGGSRPAAIAIESWSEGFRARFHVEVRQPT
jgi:hypothetical protein